jgi:GT2 family glycosyltransferase
MIPTMNRKSSLLECLASLQKIDYPKNRIELLIWDNNSDDGTQEAVKDLFDKMQYNGWGTLKLIKCSKNLGIIKARNKLFKNTAKESKYILSVDDDVILFNDTLKELVIFVERDDAIGIVGGRIVYKENPLITAHGANYFKWWLGINRNYDEREPVECDWVIACGCLFRKEIVDLIGGYDDDYYTCFEETDFCTKAKRCGYKVMYVPKAIFVHNIPIKKQRKSLYYLYRNKLLLIKKNATFPQKLTSLTLYAFFWLPKIILDSIMVNKGINSKEIKIILKAVYHGIIGKVGEQQI